MNKIQFWIISSLIALLTISGFIEKVDSYLVDPVFSDELLEEWNLIRNQDEINYRFQDEQPEFNIDEFKNEDDLNEYLNPAKIIRPESPKKKFYRKSRKAVSNKKFYKRSTNKLAELPFYGDNESQEESPFYDPSDDAPNMIGTVIPGDYEKYLKSKSYNQNLEQKFERKDWKINKKIADLLRYYVVVPAKNGWTKFGNSILKRIDEKIPYWEQSLLESLQTHGNMTGTSAFLMDKFVIPILSKHYKVVDRMLVISSKRTALLVTKAITSQLMCQAEELVSPYIPQGIFEALKNGTEVNISNAELASTTVDEVLGITNSNEPENDSYDDISDDFSNIPGAFPNSKRGYFSTSGLFSSGRNKVCKPLVNFTRKVQRRASIAVRIITANYITAFYSILPRSAQYAFSYTFLLPKPGEYQYILDGEYEEFPGWSNESIDFNKDFIYYDDVYKGDLDSYSKNIVKRSSFRMSEANTDRLVSDIGRISIEESDTCKLLDYGKHDSDIPFLRKLYNYIVITENELAASNPAWYNITGTFKRVYKQTVLRQRKFFHQLIISSLNYGHQIFSEYIDILMEEKMNSYLDCSEQFGNTPQIPISQSFETM